MAKKIKYEDLVEGDAFGKLIKEGEAFDKVLLKMADSYTKMMVAKKGNLGATPTTLKESEDMQKLLAQISKMDSELQRLKKTREQLTVETAKAKIQQQEYDKAIKETAKDELGLISAYQKESATLNQMRKQYKDLALAQKESGKEGKELLANITKLDAKLKQVDATVGQHQRNVGNYASSLGGLKTGLLEIGGALGLAFGVHQVVDFGKESVKAFLDAEKNAISLKNALHGNSLAFDTLMTQSAELQDKSIFSDDDIQMAQKQLAVYGLTADQIEKLTPQIVDLASKTGDDLSTATEKSISAINGQTKGLKQVGISFKDTGSKTENFALLTEKLAKFQGASAEALENTIGKAKRLENAFGDIQETIGEYLVNEGALILDNFEAVFGDKNAVLVRQMNEKIDKSMDEANLNMLKRAKESESNRLNAIRETEKQIQDLAKAGLKTTDANSKKIVAHQIASQQHLLAELKKLADKQVIEDDATAGAKEDKTKDEANKRWEEAVKEAERLTDVEVTQIQRIEDLKKKHRKQVRDAEIDSQKEATADANKMWDDQTNEELKAWDKARDLKKKKDEEQKAKDKEERERALDQAEMLYDIWKEAQEKKSKEAIDYIDHEIDRNQSALEIQAGLAERGMANTMAFELQKQQELEKSRMQELERQKKVAKQQEVLELSLAFLKAYETYISQDMKSGQALLRASGDIMSAKLLSKAIAGSAFDGTEDTGGAGTVDNKGGKLWVLHPNERVLSKEQNYKLNGISNDDLVRNALMFDNIMKPNFNAGLNDVSVAKQVVDAQNSVLVSEIKTLQRIIKNKPETSINIDNAGSLIKKTIANGLATTTIKKTFIN